LFGRGCISDAGIWVPEIKEMKKLLLLIFVLIFNSCIDDDWDLNFTGKLQNTFLFDGWINYGVCSSVLSNDGNVLITGNRNEKISVLKTTVKGDVFWRRDFMDNGLCSAQSIVQTTDNSIYVCGRTIQNWIEKRADIFILKLNSKGDSVWVKTFGSAGFEYPDCIISTTGNNLLIAGKTTGPADNPSDIYLIKLNYNGEIIWERTYPDPDDEFATHVFETREGDFVITGNDQASEPDTANKIYLLKVDAQGNIRWEKRFGLGTGDWKWGYSTIETINGDLVTCGRLTKDGYTQVLLLKTNMNGEFLWEKNFGEPLLSETGYSLKINHDNTIIITGTSFEVSNPDTEIILLKTDENGKELWFQRFGASYNSDGFNILKYGRKNIITGNYYGQIFMSVLNDNGKGN
jgi:hypothetical protein